jgi:hypothetical protein
MPGTIPTNALSMADWAKFQNDPLITKTVMSLYELCNVLTYVPMTAAEQTVVRGSRWAGNLPSVNGIGFNTIPAYFTGTPEHYTEQVGLIRDSLAVDKLLLRDKLNISDPAKQRIDAYLKAFTYKMNDVFINGNPVDEPFLPVGVKWRLDNPGRSGVFSTDGSTTELKIDAACDVRLATLGTTATGPIQSYTFIESFRRMLTRLGRPTGKGVTAFMNEEMFNRIPVVIGAAGEGYTFEITKDQYDRRVATFMDCQLVPIGRKADQTTQIITITEDTTGAAASSEYTSIYFCVLDEEHFSGWHFDPPKFIPLGLDDTGILNQWTFEYAYGLRMESNRSLGRLYDIRFGSV